MALNSKLAHLLLVAIAVVALSLIHASPALPAEVPSGDILIFAAHPDDDVLIAAGIAIQASGQVTIAYMTNGDRCVRAQPWCPVPDPNIGTTRQVEAVAAQAILGQAESDLIFLGYPNGFLDDPAGALLTETYASHGLGFTDWFDYRTGSTGDHAPYTQLDMQSDVDALIEMLRPDDIFTHSRFDRHVDHSMTYKFLVQAVAYVQTIDPTYNPIIHTAIVHTISKTYGAWPDSSGPAFPNVEFLAAQNCTTSWPECDSSGELVWDQREAYVVPVSMQNTDPAVNTKSKAIDAHVSQTSIDTFIRRFARKDEIFWAERLGSAEGRDDSGFFVDEGGVLIEGGSGVLKNDARGVQATAGLIPPVVTQLGPMTAVIQNDVSNGTLILNSDGSFTYTHDGSETVSDSFTYWPVQGAVQGSVATVLLTINPVDDDPVAVDDGPYAGSNGAVLTVAVPGVLGNDSDPESLTLSTVLVSDVSNGVLALAADGSFTYTHDGSATMSDSFTYKAKDPAGNLSGAATVSITIADAPISVMVDGPSFGAPGVTASFNPMISGGTGTVTYAWSVERLGAVVASGSGSSIEFTPTFGGIHTVKVTIMDDAGSDTDEVDLAVLGDIGDSGFVGNILWLAEQGITKGCNPPANDEFCPNDPVTRGQMAAFLVRFLGLTDDGGGNTFTDDDDSIFKTDIAKLAAAGITKGCNPPTNDNFCPNDTVTRGQMAAFLVRALGLTDDGGGNTFTDDDGSIFETDIAKLATAGITKGCNPPTNDNFCPNNPVTRGQMAAFLNRANDI